jgi:hypothetical protein
MGLFKGLSTEQTYARGTATLNLIDGTVSVAIDGLPKAEGWDVWLVDNGVGSVLPEAGENMLRIGSLQFEGKAAKLKADLGKSAFSNFELDLIVITKAGMSPIENRALVGTTTLFNRLYRTKQRGDFGRLSDHPQTEAAPSKRDIFARLLDAVMPTAEAQIGPQEGVNNLITRGRNSFINETFNGNGRTCATCHREEESMTISPEFISTLSLNDPLFVAETQPALAQNFENPVLMRKFGLILENPDGFDNLAKKFVMRGVPHTLALLQNTLTPVAGGADGTTIPPNERTGWGGDGAPGTGTLREFIIGAITQHYPKTLARVPAGGGLAGDFRLPTVAELDELEAFQKSTGRRADLVLSGTGALRLKSEVAALGQRIFNNPSPLLGLPSDPTIGAGSCFVCHLNAGASDFFFAGQNANFNTNVEGLPAQPADLVGQPNPQDGGFGTTGVSPTGGIGNGSFNTPVLVEAGDTGPFFHNNAIDTLEGAVDFYNSDAFNKAPGFGGIVTGNQGLVNLAATEVVAVAAFMRAINALENIRSARDLAVRARNSTDLAIVDELLKLAIAEAEDAHKVLNCGNLHFVAQRNLVDAIARLVVAMGIDNKPLRDAEINAAIVNFDRARNDIRF